MGRYGRTYYGAPNHTKAIQPILCPEAYPIILTGQSGNWPSASGTKPTPRAVVVAFMLGFLKAGIPVRSTILPFGNLATPGTQTMRIRQAVFENDSLWYQGDANHRGMHETLIPGLTHTTGISVADARTNGGGASTRAFKFPFDSEYTPPEDKVVTLCTAYELMYLSDGDTAGSAVIYGGSNDGACQRWFSEVSGGSLMGRNYHYTSLIANLDTLTFSTFENPATASYTFSGGTTITFGGVTVTMNNMVQHGWYFAPY